MLDRQGWGGGGCGEGDSCLLIGWLYVARAGGRHKFEGGRETVVKVAGGHALRLCRCHN